MPHSWAAAEQVGAKASSTPCTSYDPEEGVLLPPDIKQECWGKMESVGQGS